MSGFRRALRVLARPVQTNRRRSGLVIQAYRGYGSPEEVFVTGRVLRQPRFGLGIRKDALNRDLIDVARRMLRRGVRNAVVEASIPGGTQRVASDRDGYFHVHLRPSEPLQNDGQWTCMRLVLVEPAGASVDAVAQVFVPPREARFVVVSDIDDTVMHTGVANKLGMLWRLFVEGADSRVAFPGVAAFYTALHRGASGTECNPMLYVSRGPWSLYEVLETFFNLHRIPVGPILFLREWGLTLQRPLPRRAESHKIDLIRTMLSLYTELPFVLIGDSGQHDPEIYARIVHENPGRVRAVYIRNVSRDPERTTVIEGLAQELVENGSSLLLASDSFAMAEHAAQHGLLSPEDLAAILADKREQERTPEGHKPGIRPDSPRLHKIQASTPRETKAAVARGELRKVLREEPDKDSAPNVAIEPKRSGDSQSS